MTIGALRRRRLDPNDSLIRDLKMCPETSRSNASWQLFFRNSDEEVCLEIIDVTLILLRFVNVFLLQQKLHSNQRNSYLNHQHLVTFGANFCSVG
jgi:hypothetical protein